jgi:hypothetical protein
MQPTPIQRIVLVVIIVFMVASIILGLVYPNDPVIVAVRMFAFGACLVALPRLLREGGNLPERGPKTHTPAISRSAPPPPA